MNPAVFISGCIWPKDTGQAHGPRTRGRLTQDGKDDPDGDHAHVDEVPHIHGVEDTPGIYVLADLVVEEGSEPDVEQNLEGRDRVPVLLDEDTIVQAQEAGEEHDFIRLEILGHPQPGKRVRLERAVELGLLGRVYREMVPENDLAVPYIGDDLLHHVLAQEPLSVSDGRDLQRV